MARLYVHQSTQTWETELTILSTTAGVYHEPAFPLLQQTLRDLIGPETVCYFCYKRRRRADIHFMKAVKRNLAVEDVLDDPDRAIYASENIFLYAHSDKVFVWCLC
ncbi:hypothetical protein LTR36_005183 [Oleoguttula mirabilis]|uniref:Uncharacterized protein n=1 Tax=Oleoguttula mirabilis TaxID=1507867 RepID=A0AAV9JVX0_9PEZI|nr:hypothetical protein LTR36_005183 [Oleoguttula mirabilis]